MAKRGKPPKGVKQVAAVEKREPADAMTERVAGAIRKALADQVREAAAAVAIPCEDVRAVFQAALSEGDRAAAILLFALVEDILQEMYERHLNPAITGGVSDLLRANGPLATAHNRIAFAGALYWIERRTYQALNLMRKIRNNFAHSIECSSFKDRSVIGMVTSMPDFEKILEAAEVKKAERYSVRDLFFMRSIVAICRAYAEAAAVPFARLSGVASKDILVDWESMPENLKEIQRLAAEFVIHIDARGSTTPLPD